MTLHDKTEGRSLVRAIAWRLLGALLTSLLVYFLTADYRTALLLGLIAALVDTLINYVKGRVEGQATVNRPNGRPAVVWLTGLSGSGKTTIANRLHERLSQHNVNSVRLDGDEVRAVLNHVGYEKEDRINHVKSIGFLASKLEETGFVVIASLISPYKECRDAVRLMCTNYIEVHVSTPFEVCKERDVKGLYGKAERNQLANFTGIDSQFEVPDNPEITIDTVTTPVDDAVERIMEKLR